MPKFSRLSVPLFGAFFFLSAFMSTPAIAGGFDDFLDRVADVATDTYNAAADKVVSAADYLRDLTSKIRTQRESASQSVQTELQRQGQELKLALAQTEVELKGAIRRLKASLDEANKLLGQNSPRLSVPTHGLRQPIADLPNASSASSAPPTGSIDRAKRPPLGAGADPKTLAEADLVATLERRLDVLRRQEDAQANAVNEKIAVAHAKSAASANAVNEAFQRIVGKPIEEILAALQDAIAHPLNVGNIVVAALDAVNQAANGMAAEILPLLNTTAAGARDSAKEAQLSLTAILKSAAESEKLTAALKRATTFHSDIDRSVFMRELDAQAVAGPARPATNMGATTRPEFQAAVRRFATVTSELKAGARRFAPHPTPARRAAAARIAGELDVYFKGKSPAEARRQHDELVREARLHFAGEPSKLKAVERFLSDEARARGAP